MLLYNQIVESKQTYLYHEEVSRLIEYHKRGNPRSRLRVLEAIMDIFDGWILYYGSLEQEFLKWTEYETKGGDIPISIFISSSYVRIQQQEIVSTILNYIDQIIQLLDSETDKRLIRGVVMSLISRQDSHMTSLGASFETIARGYTRIKDFLPLQER